MGSCLSSPTAKPYNKSPTRREGRCSAKEPPSTTVKIITMDGKVQEYKQPIQARFIAAQNPSSFLCNSESLSIDSCPPRMDEEEDLQLGQIYFLLPLSQARKPLKLPDLCELAVKASSVLGASGSNLFFR